MCGIPDMHFQKYAGSFLLTPSIYHIKTSRRMTIHASRLSQGELVENLILNLLPEQRQSGLVDIGANLCDRASFDRDRQAVIDRAHKSGVSHIILTGSCVPSSSAAAKLSSEKQGFPTSLSFTAGVHPHNAKYWESGGVTEAALVQLAGMPHCVAIGECGLDYNRNFSSPNEQREVFASQLAIAQQLSMPVFLHCRDAWHDFFGILDPYERTLQGVVHCFTGSESDLRKALNMGLYIGVTGWVCDDRIERGGWQVARLLSIIPDDKLLLETDAPYLTPRNIEKKSRPHRCEPALLHWVLMKVAEARGQSLAHVAQVTTQNARRLFSM